MIRVIAALLIVWEPLRFASEALGVLPTIAFRGAIAALELAVHGAVAAVAAASGFALFNGAPDARRLAALAVTLVALRTIQSLYFSVLPDQTPPGMEPLYAGAATVVAATALALLRRRS